MQGKGPWWLTNVIFFLWFEFLKKSFFHLNFALFFFFFYRAIRIFLLENMCFMRAGSYQKSQRMQTLVGRQSNRVCVCVCETQGQSGGYLRRRPADLSVLTSSRRRD